LRINHRSCGTAASKLREYRRNFKPITSQDGCQRWPIQRDPTHRLKRRRKDLPLQRLRVSAFFFVAALLVALLRTGQGAKGVAAAIPLFAAAFATHHNWQAFLVGLAASIGAGISMGFAEALSDDGSLTGRGSPWLRGLTCGLMTTVGGLGHTMPYLVPDTWPNAFWIATAMAGIVVFFELWAIAYIRARYMDTPFLQAVFQIVLGGAIVLAVGILIGAA
jgi:hypothetical protein